MIEIDQLSPADIFPQKDFEQPSGPGFDKRLENWVAERQTDTEGKKNRQSIVKAIKNDQSRSANMKTLSGSEVLHKALSTKTKELLENKTQLILPDGLKVVASVDVEDPVEKGLPNKWGESQNKSYTLELLVGPNGEMVARKVTIIKGSQANPSGRIIHEQAIIGPNGQTSLTIQPESQRFFQYDPNVKQEVIVAKEVVATDENKQELEEKIGEVKFKNNDGSEEVFDVKKPVLATGLESQTVGSLVNVANPEIVDRTDLQEATALLFKQLSEKIFKETKNPTKKEVVKTGLQEANRLIDRKISDLLENKPNTFYSRDFLKTIQHKERLEQCLEGSRFEGQTFQEWFDQMAFINQVIKKKGKTLQVQGGNGFLLRCLQEWSGSGDKLIPYVIDPEEEYVQEARQMFSETNPDNFSDASLAAVLEKPEDHNLPTEYDNILWVPEGIIRFDTITDLEQIKALFDRGSISGRLVVAFPEYPKDTSMDGLDDAEKILKQSRMDAFENIKAYLSTKAAQDKGLSLGGVLENDRSDQGILLWIDHKEKYPSVLI